MTVITVFLHSILLSCYTVFQGADTLRDITCVGSIGRIPTTFDVAFKSISNFSGLYLNTNSMSTCNGTVIAWNYCYYVNIQGTNRQLTKIQAGVWRRQEMGYYQLVTNSLTDIPIPPLDGGLQFVCREWYLNFDKTFEVQEGDIVGLHAEKSGVIHFLGISTSNEQDNGTQKAEHITDTTSPVSPSELIVTPYALYLMAVIGKFSNSLPRPDEPTTEHIIMAGLGAFILLLLIIIMATVCKLYCRRIHTRKETGPVLIRYGNGRLNWTAPVLQNPARRDSIENSSDGTQTPLPQPSNQHTISPPVVMATSPLQPEPHQPTSPSISPPPKVFTVVFDDEQLTDDQDKVLVDPRSQHPTINKVSLLSSLLPKSDIKRSHSENEALKLLHTHGIDDREVASTEYPYVLHAFEVIGKQQASIGSVPKVLEHHTPLKNSHSLDKIHLHSNKQGHPNAVGYVNLTEGAHYYSVESIDDLSYSYVDKKTLVHNATSMLRTSRYDQDNNLTSQNRDKYPSSCTQALQSGLGFVNQTTNSTGDVMSDKVTQTQSGTQTNEKFQLQPSPMRCSNPLQLDAGAESEDVTGDNVASSVQLSHKYMKLLASTMADRDCHKYASLQRKDTELSEMSINDLDSERAHPEEWCKHTPH